MKALTYAIIIILNVVLQGTVVPSFSILGKVPNTALIIVVIIALTRGKWKASVVGLIMGLLLDILYSMVVGINAFILFFVGYFIGLIEGSLARDNSINPVIFTALGTVFYNLCFYIIMFFLAREITFGAAIKEIFSIEILYNSLVAALFYKLYTIIFTQPKIRFTKR